MCQQTEAGNVDDTANPPWRSFLKSGFENLATQLEHNFTAPPAESDKLYMTIGERDVIEVAHPSAPEEDFAYKR